MIWRAESLSSGLKSLPWNSGMPIPIAMNWLPSTWISCRTLRTVQEEALLAWFTSEQEFSSVPDGDGKTLIAEAALFEALHTGKVAYYTTPLIALTEQKFHEMQAAAVRWGFSGGRCGAGHRNRRVNPDAKVLVVVAEILLNRLLHRTLPISPTSPAW